MDIVLSSEILAIRRLNDQLRQQGIGGRIMLSASIAALTQQEVIAIVSAVATFDAFTPDNDPHGEHDCAILVHENRRIMLKIDYYDPTLQYHSDDPADPNKTARVMTVLFASEY